jgi:hypothetical protein
MGGGVAAGFLSAMGDAAKQKADSHKQQADAQKSHQADIYWGVIKNPDSSPEQIQYAQGQLQKLYGNSGPLKELFQKFGAVIQQTHPGHQQPPATGANAPLEGGGVPKPPAAPGATGAPSSVPPPPTMPNPGATPGGATPMATSATPDSGATATSSGGFPITNAGGPRSSVAPPPAAPGGAPTVAGGKATSSGGFAIEHPGAVRSSVPAPPAPPSAPASAPHVGVLGHIRNAVGKGIEGIGNAMPGGSGGIGDSRFDEMAHQAAGPTTQEQHDRDFKDWERKQDVETQNKIKETQAKVKAEAEAKGVKGSNPKPMNYEGPDGKPLFGSYIVTPDGKTILYDQEGNELPPDTHKFSAWMSPRTTVTDSFKVVPQPDGRIAVVPVETRSTMTRGKGAASGGSGGGQASSGGSRSSTAKPPQASNDEAAALGLPKGSKIVGGKVPPGVAKAYETYNGAQERYNVMQKSYVDAMKGNQQAMLNLLANHIGMTMGLQKGARITQAIYSEALQSAPYLERVEAHFDKDGYLSGVVLTPEQMNQMMPLAKDRLDEDKAAWDREVKAAKGGYGMGKEPPAAPVAPPPKDRPPLSSFDAH